jgi:hypothetical protein
MSSPRIPAEVAHRIVVRTAQTGTHIDPVFASVVPVLSHVPLRMLGDGNAALRAVVPGRDGRTDAVSAPLSAFGSAI